MPRIMRLYAVLSTCSSSCAQLYLKHGTGRARLIQALNEFANQAPSVDGAAIHVHIKPQNGVLIYRNWAHDLTTKAFRFDRVNSASATWGVNGTVVENVAWRVQTAAFKGDHHHICKNTIFDGTNEVQSPALFVMMCATAPTSDSCFLFSGLTSLAGRVNLTSQSCLRLGTFPRTPLP